MKRSAWSGLARGAVGSISDAVADLMRRGDVVSVYECAGRAELELVAVALSSKRSRQPFHYVGIAAEDLASAAVVRAPRRAGLRFRRRTVCTAISTSPGVGRSGS